MHLRNKLRIIIFIDLALLAACQPLSGPPAPVDYPAQGQAALAMPLATPPAPLSSPTSSTQPPAQPTNQPTNQPPNQPTNQPSTQSTNQPTTQPTTPISTSLPIYLNLRGEVSVEHAACLYGPGAAYLYKYGLLGGSNLEIIGRNTLGTWIEIRAIGGTNPCWVKASLMKIKGDVTDVAPVDPDQVGLPQSPYYGPPAAVSAARHGDVVTVMWTPVYLKAGDDSGQYPYLVEAWVCRAGQIVFTPLGSYQTALEIADEPGCTSPSAGRVYTVEKHGYSRWRKIAWPQAGALSNP